MIWRWVSSAQSFRDLSAVFARKAPTSIPSQLASGSDTAILVPHVLRQFSIETMRKESGRNVGEVLTATNVGTAANTFYDANKVEALLNSEQGFSSSPIPGYTLFVAFGWFDSEPLEQLRVAQWKFDHLPDSLNLAVEPTDVFVCDNRN